jgi:alpha-tubulin suppressor-like RCC1 family protein
MLTSTILFIGCGGDSKDGGDTQSSNNKGISLDLQLSGLYYGKDTSSTTSSKSSLNAKVATSTNSDIYRGELKVLNLSTGVENIYDWFAYVNRDTLVMTSTQKLLLAPGEYQFSLLLNFGARQYATTATYTVTDGKTESIPFVVDPIIGDTIISVDDIINVASIKFKYKSSELLDYLSPKIHLSIDGGETIIYDINKDNGMSSVYITMPEGEHNISLDFFDGNMHIGKSTSYPATINIEANQNINLDVEPLYSTISFATPYANSGIYINMNVPSQIIAEAGTLSNLKSIIKYTSTNSNINGEMELNVTADTNSTYSQEVSLGKIKDINITISFEFTDRTTGDIIATMNLDNIYISSQNQTIQKSIEIRRKIYATGNLLSVIGITIFDTTGFPSESAKIYANSELIGITGEGGYLKSLLKKGIYTITAKKDTLAAQKDINISTLQVYNMRLDLSDINVTIPSDSQDGNNDANSSDANSGDSGVTDGNISLEKSFLNRFGIGTGYSVIIKSDGTLWTWGHNYYKQLGDGGTSSRAIPQKVDSSTDWISINTGNYHTVALKSDGTLWVWGPNHNYDGISTPEAEDNYRPIQVRTATKPQDLELLEEPTWRSVSTGTSHTLMIADDGTLWGWGINDNGNLGDDSTTSYYIPKQIGSDHNWKSIHIGIGNSYTLGIKDDNTLWGWGTNVGGELGNGFAGGKQKTPTQIGDKKWKSVSPGFSSVVAIRDDDTLWVWGSNTYGVLGNGASVSYLVPTQIQFLHKWKIASTSRYSSAAIRSDGTLWAWGQNEYGQLCDNTKNNRYTPKQIGSDNNWVAAKMGYKRLYAMKSDGTIWGCGSNNNGELGDGTKNDRSTLQKLDFTLD